MFSITDKEESVERANRRAEFLEKYVIPRYIGNTFIVILWSLFEDEMGQIASYVEQNDPPTASLSDFNKRDFLEALRIFFQNTAVFFTAQGTELKELKSLYLVRNQIVHENARIMKSTDKKIVRLLDSDIGISKLGDRIVVEESYCRSAYDLVAKVLHDQLDRSFDPYSE